MREAFFGAGFHDFILRFYTFHVFMLPIALLGLMVFHFPRFMVFDVPMVMAISGAIILTGGVFPVGLGLPFQPDTPPGITVPEWYLTGLYAFLRTMYDKFTTGVAWPGLFIFALLIVPFIDRYKKFSWKDRPLITALGITSLAQIIVTTYWGFYIDPDRDKALLERLVIDPIFFYLVMILLVPLSFGFTYMIIKLAKNAEANAKLQPRKAGKNSINIPQKWIYILFVVLLAFQVYLNIAAYYACTSGDEELLPVYNRHNHACVRRRCSTSTDTEELLLKHRLQSPFHLCHPSLQLLQSLCLLLPQLIKH